MGARKARASWRPWGLDVEATGRAGDAQPGGSTETPGAASVRLTGAPFSCRLGVRGASASNSPIALPRTYSVCVPVQALRSTRAGSPRRVSRADAPGLRPHHQAHRTWGRCQGGRERQPQWAQAHGAVALAPGLEQAHVAHEGGDEVRGRVLVQLARRALLHHTALVQQRDAVADGHGLALVVRHVDQRQPELGLQVQDLPAQAPAQARVQVRHRLVQQQQGRAGGERAREGDALLLALGELVGPPRRQRLDTEQLQRLASTRYGSRGSGRGQAQAEGHVVQHRQVGKQARVLGHQAHGPLRCRQRSDVDAVDLDMPAGGRLEPGHHAQQRGLAGARRAEQCEHLAVAHRQPDRIQHRLLRAGWLPGQVVQAQSVHEPDAKATAAAPALDETDVEG